MKKLKKLVAISDYFPNCMTPRKKVVSGFGLGFVLFFIFIFLLVCNFSFKNPNSDKLYFQGFNISNSKNSSIIAWSYSISTTSSFIENATLLEQNPKIVVSESRVESNGSSLDIKLKFKGIDEKGNTHFGNFTGDGKNRSFNGVSSKILDFDDTRLMKLSNDGKNESLIANFAKILEIEDTHLMKFKNDGKNGSFNGVSSKILDFEDTHLMKVKNDVKNGSFSANSVKILDIEDTYLMKVKDVKNGSFSAITMNPNEGKVIFGQVVGNRSVKSDGLDRNSDSRNKKDEIGDGKISQILRNYSSTFEECDIFDGRWVRDDTKPYYPAGSCPFVDKDLNCHRHGRPDNEFVKWRWQPFGCEIPSLNATDFLERLRGKKMVFVGDSLNRNMWESLVCILRHSLKNKNRFYEISGKREFKKKGIYAFRFEDYNCTVDFVASPFLVRESSFKGKNGTFETLRLDLMDRATSMYQDADMLIFNTGHWWTHEKTSRGKDYYQEGNHVYPRLKALDAYSRALSTWAKWVDKNIDTRKTQVIFRGYSVTHFRGGRWDSGGQCHKETEPIYNTTHLTKYPSKMRAFENVMHVMKTPMIYLNISRLTDYRKDGHPSIYRSVSLKQQIVAEHSQDCSHWCLPGVPDTWNELLYASLLKIGRGSWKS